jgi:hypothetical protein
MLLDLSTFYALAERMLWRENGRHQARAFGVQAAAASVWSGKKKHMEHYVQVYPNSPKDQDVRRDKSTGQEKANVSGWKKLASKFGTGPAPKGGKVKAK